MTVRVTPLSMLAGALSGVGGFSLVRFPYGDLDLGIRRA